VLPEIRELRYFVAVAEERRFTHAAERLYITQQSLSAAIAQLERRLGVELFVRDRQGLRLTPAGEALLTAARGILAQAASAVEDTRRAAGAAPLRVGYAVLAASERASTWGSTSCRARCRSRRPPWPRSIPSWRPTSCGSTP
jgi:DNA-binding transcriptional LysR family regulator